MVRVGFGYDVHRLVEGRPFILGGVVIPSDIGLEGHSDADALLHAITDALLGAAGLGDIGTHFPDTDLKWKGADSAVFLTRTCELLQKAGYTIGNIDSTVVLEKPHLRPYIGEMCERIATLTGLDPSAVSVKATTNEKLGFIGARSGAAAYAVCTISSH